VRVTSLQDSELPELVSAYLQQALPQGEPLAAQVRLAVRGETRMRPGARWMRFTANGELAVAAVGLRWKARFPTLGPLAMTVIDELAAGVGTMRVNSLGMPIQRQSGPELALGETYRYLSELVFAPQAIAANRELAWSALGEHGVEVSANSGSGRATLTFEFDQTGDIVSAAAEARPMSVGKQFQATRWGAAFSEHATLAGVRIPTRSEAHWDLDEERFAYWRTEVTGAEAIG
jgi:hypothetical protein